MKRRLDSKGVHEGIKRTNTGFRSESRNSSPNRGFNRQDPIVVADFPSTNIPLFAPKVPTDIEMTEPFNQDSSNIITMRHIEDFLQRVAAYYKTVAKRRRACDFFNYTPTAYRSIDPEIKKWLELFSDDVNEIPKINASSSMEVDPTTYYPKQSPQLPQKPKRHNTTERWQPLPALSFPLQQPILTRTTQESPIVTSRSRHDPSSFSIERKAELIIPQQESVRLHNPPDLLMHSSERASYGVSNSSSIENDKIAPSNLPPSQPDPEPDLEPTPKLGSSSPIVVSPTVSIENKQSPVSKPVSDPQSPATELVFKDVKPIRKPRKKRWDDIEPFSAVLPLTGRSFCGWNENPCDHHNCDYHRKQQQFWLYKMALEGPSKFIF